MRIYYIEQVKRLEFGVLKNIRSDTDIVYYNINILSVKMDGESMQLYTGLQSA